MSYLSSEKGKTIMTQIQGPKFENEPNSIEWPMSDEEVSAIRADRDFPKSAEGVNYQRYARIPRWPIEEAILLCIGGKPGKHTFATISPLFQPELSRRLKKCLEELHWWLREKGTLHSSLGFPAHVRPRPLFFSAGYSRKERANKIRVPLPTPLAGLLVGSRTFVEMYKERCGDPPKALIDALSPKPMAARLADDYRRQFGEDPGPGELLAPGAIERWCRGFAERHHYDSSEKKIKSIMSTLRQVRKIIKDSNKARKK
jgi:hypothetical protein